SSSYKRHSQSLKVVWTDVVCLYEDSAAGRSRILSLDEDAAQDAKPHGAISRDRGRDNSGHRIHPFEQLPVKLPRLRLGVTLSPKIEADEDRVAGDEPRIDLARLLKAPHKQPRGHKREQRQRHLPRHQTRPQVDLETSLANGDRHISLQRHDKVRP